MAVKRTGVNASRLASRNTKDARDIKIPVAFDKFASIRIWLGAHESTPWQASR
jgi:hypothetical protein